MDGFDPKTYHRWRWYALSVWIVLFTLVTVYGVRQNDRTSKQIQQSRIEFCQEQNKHNTDTLQFIKDQINQRVRAGQTTQKEATKAIAQYKLLFNALAPIRDCKSLRIP